MINLCLDLLEPASDHHHDGSHEEATKERHRQKHHCVELFLELSLSYMRRQQVQFPCCDRLHILWM